MKLPGRTCPECGDVLVVSTPPDSDLPGADVTCHWSSGCGWFAWISRPWTEWRRYA